MEKQKGIFPPQRDHAHGVTTLTGIIIIVAVSVILFGGVFAWQYFIKSQTPVQDSNTETAGWKIYSDYDGITFEYPSNWIVEKEFYSTPAQQLSGEKENIGVYIYPQNRSDSIHIDGRQNSCDASQNHVKCLSKEGHIIFVDSKNQKILSQFDRIVSTLENKVQNSNFEAVDWKTYRNDEYGFEFKYPAGAFDEKSVYPINGQTECKKDYDWWSGNVYSIPIIGDNTGLVLRSYIICEKIDSLLKPIRTGVSNYSSASLKEIGNRAGYEYLIGISTTNSYHDMFLVSVGDKTLFISFAANTDNLKQINQILSTFKFTK